MKKHFIIAFFLALLTVWFVTEIRVAGPWGGPRGIPQIEILQLQPFDKKIEIAVYKDPVDENIMSQGELWMYIFTPYWYGLWVAIVYLCVVYIIRHDKKYI